MVAGFILTGGASTRMGRDKALLEIAGVPLVLRVARLLAPLVASVTLIGAPERYAHLNLRVVPDDEPGIGPLGGIATALRMSPCDWNLVVGCDLPYLTTDWLRFLIGRALDSSADAVLPESAQGYAEPLCAMYHRRGHAAIAGAMGRGVRKVTDGLAGLRIEKISPATWKQFDSAGRLFKNMNAPEDYAEAQAFFVRQGGG